MSTVPVEWTRPSDADRDRALSVLRDGAGTGRLSHDTFVRRMNLVLRARTHGELADVLRDLPRTESRLAAWTRSVREKLRRLAIDRPAGGLTAGGLAADGLAADGLAAGGLAARNTPGVRSARRRGVGRRVMLPRLSVVREVPAPPPPALALPAPESQTVRIGRGPGATLRLADSSVSRFHAELRCVGEDWMLRDLGSMNGTFVNGHRITSTVRVRPGDQVSFGAVAFTLTCR